MFQKPVTTDCGGLGEFYGHWPCPQPWPIIRYEAPDLEAFLTHMEEDTPCGERFKSMGVPLLL